LTSAGHPFDLADSLRHFVNHLPFGSTYDIIRESVIFGLSTARTFDQLPSFESVVEHITNVDLNRAYFQPPRSCHPNSDPTSTTTNSSKDTTPTPSTNVSTTNSSSQSRPSHSNNSGGQERGFTDRNKTSARAYIADVDVNPITDGSDVPLDQHPSSSSSSHSTSSSSSQEEGTTTSFAAFGTTPFVTFAASPVNNDVFFDVYRSGVILTALSSISELSPVCLSSISQTFNSILDSGCTNHIIRDRSCFWMYHTSLAVPVKTANCGVLETLAKGNVKFHVQCGSQSVVFVLRDCLHTPSAPINLLSVGAMQEHHMHVHFNEDITTIHFPSDHPILSGLSVHATVICRLSFLQCDFLVPPVPVTDGTEVAFPTFQVPDQTPALWHRRLCHLGLDATKAILMKEYATGIEWSGSFDHSDHCISCLIGKHPQIPYSNNHRWASALCELLHMDSCGPFPVLTPHKKSSFWAILDDKSNYGHVKLLSAKSDVFTAYQKVEALWEAKSGNRVVTVHMDGAKEFSHGRLAEHLTSRGVVMQVTAPYAHSQNGKAKRFIRTLEDGFQTLLADSGLPMSFWGDAVLTVAYIRNRVLTSVLPANTTPFEEMERTKPDLSHFGYGGVNVLWLFRQNSELKVAHIALKPYLLDMKRIVWVGMSAISMGSTIFLVTLYSTN